MPQRQKPASDRKKALGSIIRTLGGSGVTQIFCHGVTSFRNIHDEKALHISRREDIVCVASRVDGRYLDYLADLGVGPTFENIIVASEKVDSDPDEILADLLMNNRDALKRIRDRIDPKKAVVLNPFQSSSPEFKLARVLEGLLGTEVRVNGGSPEIVDYCNFKHHTKALALSLGVPVSKGRTVELKRNADGKPLDLEPLQSAITGLLPKTGRLIVRGSYSASGSSLFVVEDNAESVANALKRISDADDNCIYVVDVMLDVENSSNVIFHIEPGKGNVECATITDQLLSDVLVYEGSIYPSRTKTSDRMIAFGKRISKWLKARGYAGFIGFDFCEYIDPVTANYQCFLAEINPRTNASVYPRSLMEHLNDRQRERGRPCITSFVSFKLEKEMASFLALKEKFGSLFFDPETGEGIVPYNIGRLKEGKSNLVVFGKDREQVLGIYRGLANRVVNI